MSNWKPHADYSHPNWTGRTLSKCNGQLHKKEKEPSVLVQVLLGILVATTFMLGMYAL